MKNIVCLAGITAVLLAVGGPLAADVESPALAKYKKPVEVSVDKALAYLAKIQIPPGKPYAGSFECPLVNNSGVPSLCVMAFLSKGHTPGTGMYGEVINRGVDFVLSTFNSGNNMFGGLTTGGPMYQHCIATLMLAEVSGMVDPERQRKIDAVLPKALNLIVSAQKVPKNAEDAGGWRYNPTSTDSDISLTGWAVMALRAGRLNGAAIPKESIDGAVQYILKCRLPAGRSQCVFAYIPNHPRLNGSGMGRTGVGVLVLELCGQHGHPATIEGGESMLRGMPRSVRADMGAAMFYYGEYYCSQAMFQLGGKYWETWAPVMYDTLMKGQQNDGSWPEDMHEWAKAGGQAYSTAMSVLAMTVSYRQLPIYQR